MSAAREAASLTPAVWAGISTSTATIEYSYVADISVSSARGDDYAGALIGGGGGSTAASYYPNVDADGNILRRSAGGIARGDDEMRSGMPSAGIYSGWTTTDWHFGSEQQYPALRHTMGDEQKPSCVQPPIPQLSQCATALPPAMSADDKAVVCLGRLPESASGTPYCGALLPDQRLGLIRLDPSAGLIVSG